MKKHFVVSNPGGMIIAGIITGIGVAVPLITAASVNAFSRNASGSYPGMGNSMGFVMVPVCIFCSLFLLLGIYLIVKSAKGLYCHSMAMKGHKAYGIVKDSYYTTGKNSTYVLNVSYVTESGENAIFTCNPGPRFSGYCMVGKKIPIYLNGEYACLDEEGIQNPSKDAPEDDVFVNFCPSCGSTVDLDSKFCKNCGTRL